MGNIFRLVGMLKLLGKHRVEEVYDKQHTIMVISIYCRPGNNDTFPPKMIKAWINVIESGESCHCIN
jgi:hypothetical protein